MNKKYAINKKTKEIVEVLTTRSFTVARGGFKVRCVEFMDIKPIPKTQDRQLHKLPIKMFKDHFIFVDAEVGKILYAN